ncbi:MAG: hypothetical protein Q9163_000214 [Psora crenata]
MSTLKDGTQGAPLLSGPHRGKRGACDRCRGQKLRCLREDKSQDSPQATCVRCLKAGATCSFGVAKRAGRPPRPKAPSLQERRGNGSGKARKHGTPSAPTVSATPQSGSFGRNADGAQDRHDMEGPSDRSLGEHSADHGCGWDTEDATPMHALSPSSLQETSDILAGVNLDFPESSMASLAWPDEPLPPFANIDGGQASGFPVEPFDLEYSYAFPHYHVQPMDIQIQTATSTSNEELSRNKGDNAYGTPATTCSSNAQIPGPSDRLSNLGSWSGGASTQQFDAVSAPDARWRLAVDGNRESARESPSSSMGSTAKPEFFSDSDDREAGDHLDDKALSGNDIPYQRMQKLSQLAMDLYVRLEAYDSEGHQPTSGAAATTFQAQLVGSVLKSSSTFLTLLASFSAPATPSAPFAPPLSTPTLSHSDSTYNFTDSGASSLASALNYVDLAMDDPLQNPYRELLAGSSDASGPPPPLDMTTVLQLLSCYIRIIHLHSIMHARILDCLLAFRHDAQHVDSVPPVFPGMEVGGVSLNKFGTMQVDLLLQISLHMLGEVESALGLPEEYRIGKKKARGRGILEASVSGGFVGCLMKEVAWGGKRVESVKEQLRNLRRVLKEAIDI